MSDRDSHAPKGIYDEQEIEVREDAPVVPVDLRDDIGSSQDALRPPLAGEHELAETDTERASVNPSALPDAAFDRNRRPDAVRQPTRDTSLSRDVDLEATGGDPEARHGMSDGPTV